MSTLPDHQELSCLRLYPRRNLTETLPSAMERLEHRRLCHDHLLDARLKTMRRTLEELDYVFAVPIWKHAAYHGGNFLPWFIKRFVCLLAVAVHRDLIVCVAASIPAHSHPLHLSRPLNTGVDLEYDGGATAFVPQRLSPAVLGQNLHAEDGACSLLHDFIVSPNILHCRSTDRFTDNSQPGNFALRRNTTWNNGKDGFKSATAAS
ncbi:hypothetical protein BDZ89DRAFT_1126755 [Hymenopellis radicata]|nr:hypothetical protein BDZ89DRAFT_1126755 [Hymenopellis radicata]